MRKLLTFLIASIFSIAVSASSFGGSMMLLGVGGPPAGGGATTTWNPSDKSAGISLDGTKLIATQTIGSTNQGVRAASGHSTGKFFASLVASSSNNQVNGISTTGLSLTAGGMTSGTSNVGFFNGGAVFFNVCTRPAPQVGAIFR
jgi:hypothetical protein